MVLRFALLLLVFTSSLQALVLEDLLESNQLVETLKGKKLGYYTGSFDPIHVGHTGFAEGTVEAGLCDYVLIVPAWGGDGYKERAPVTARLEMQYALFANDPYIIVTKLSPLEVQQALTKEALGETIRGYPLVKPFDEAVTFIGLIGSDTALNLTIPSSDEQEEANRKKRLQVFMSGVSIPEKHAETTIGSIMALPVSHFIVGLRHGDDLSVLKGKVGDRLISNVYENELAAQASSTLVKERLKTGEAMGDLIDPEVLVVIQKHNLYSGEKESALGDTSNKINGD